MRDDHVFANEAELVACFCSCIDPAKWRNNPSRAPKWQAYHETAGWDLLLVDPSGLQVGIEAKMSLNAKVLEQALPGHYSDENGPDYRAVLVPQGKLQHHLSILAANCGVTVITVRGGDYPAFNPSLPDEKTRYRLDDWWNWCPVKRCDLPDYVPDVAGGKPSPLTLTPWKVKAIKLLILLERRGSVHRQDMITLGLSQTNWTRAGYGFLRPTPDGYVRCDRTPDLKAQHPRNWAEIEADFDVWSKDTSKALI